MNPGRRLTPLPLGESTEDPAMVTLRVLLPGLAWLALATLPAAEEAIRLQDPLCVMTTFIRHTLVATGSMPAGELTAAITPPAWGRVVARAADPTHLDLAITATQGGDGVLTLRHPTRGEVASTRVRVVRVASTAVSGISSEATLADGSVVFQGELVLTPHVPGLDLRFISLGKGNTVQDGHDEWWVSTDQFTQVPVTGSSWIPFRIVRPPRGKWVPYTSTLYQEGEQVGAF